MLTQHFKTHHLCHIDRMGDISCFVLEIHWQTQTNRDPHGTNLVSATCDPSLFVLSNRTFVTAFCRDNIIDVSVMSNLVWDISMPFAEIPHSGSGMTDTRGQLPYCYFIQRHIQYPLRQQSDLTLSCRPWHSILCKITSAPRNLQGSKSYIWLHTPHPVRTAGGSRFYNCDSFGSQTLTLCYSGWNIRRDGF